MGIGLTEKGQMILGLADSPRRNHHETWASSIPHFIGKSMRFFFGLPRLIIDYVRFRVCMQRDDSEESIITYDSTDTS